ncbi:MAG TPA: Hsp33 family molecular chaperone HslO [Hypericibacter adhaerens]|uniref:Hsp33 family molecular chaperone HslO n=1 Tax=Hypericibacter adhaerens TaxID=2602016 RepID=UPI002BACE84D|nr:Hsp33 family molecular chaperone HslO [Hypericibacter adhaerens]HWA42560.1 Hsp33 family molecular chaperone HslO [Hypericibacter adhaerens]
MSLETRVETEGDDRVLPFQIEASALRGRVVRMGPLLDEVLRHHAYPKPVAERLAEMLALAALLSGALKFEGVFTLQIKGDGPVKLMVADVTSAGHMRGYAQFDAAAVAALGTGPAPSVPRLFGAGYLALTVDQGAHTERYQGIVELTGATLAECVHGYFRQSEQLEAAVMVAARAPSGGGNRGWRAGALMLQRLPTEGTELVRDDADEAWRHALILMSSCSPAELTSADLPAEDLLFRLFHEDGVRVFRDHALEARCRCSRERVERVLEALPQQDLEEMKVEGEVVVTCEFCSRVYRFGDSEIAALAKS